MKTATITAKGQITIPKNVRQALNLHPQDRVIFMIDEERIILIPAKNRTLTELRGSLPVTTPYPGQAEIRQTVRQKRGEALADSRSKD